MLIVLNHVGVHNCMEGKLFQIETLYSLLFAYSSNTIMIAVLTDIRYEKVSLTFISSESWAFIYRFKIATHLALSDKSNQIRCLMWDSPLCI